MDSDKKIDPVEKALQELAHANSQISTNDIMHVYDNWSTYDEALAAVNYKGAKVAGDAVVKYLSDNKDVSVLDVAAGTGLVGEEKSTNRMDSAKRMDPVAKAHQEVGKIRDKSTTEVINVYDNWSSYDEALGALNYKGAKLAGVAAGKYLSDNKNVSILDVAAGTGLSGEELKTHGFNNIDALDPSEGMLNIAREKNIYINYIQEFFPCEKPSVKTSSYDALVVAGGIAEGHMDADCLPEMVRCVKTGGFVIITMRIENLEEFLNRLESRMKQLETEGQWQLLERTVIPNFFEVNNGILFVLKVTKPDK